MKQYLNALSLILNNGVEKTDRTGVGTLSVFGHQMRFDLKHGFPAVTTKKLAWRSVVSELLWMLEGSTDERRLAEILHEKSRGELIDKTTIWTANADQQGKDLGYANTDRIKLLGPLYGHAWTKASALTTDTIIEVQTKVFSETNTEVVIEDSDTDSEDDYLGKKYENHVGTEYKILRKVSQSSYQIQCIQTGHKETVTVQSLKKGVFGQKVMHGKYYSTISKDDNIPYYNKAYDVWHDMISKCHDPLYDDYDLHGGRGVFVDERWNNFENFLNDLEKLPLFYEWIKESPGSMCLDIFYYGTNKFSKDTCVFLPKYLHQMYSDPCNDFSEKGVVELPNSSNFEFLHVDDLLNKFPDMKFDKATISECFDNQNIVHQKCKFYKIKAPDGHVFRKRHVINQISELVENLEKYPDSRRHVVSAWDVGKISDMALPPCHSLFQFYVSDNKLNCQLYQRSVDAPLGLPFNIASYALLTHMMAQIVGLDVGEFVHTSGDLHIYNNQVEGIRKQLGRHPLDLPTLEMPEFNSLQELLQTKTIQYKLINYQNHGTITMPMAV